MFERLQVKISAVSAAPALPRLHTAVLRSRIFFAPDSDCFSPASRENCNETDSPMEAPSEDSEGFRAPPSEYSSAERFALPEEPGTQVCAQT